MDVNTSLAEYEMRRAQAGEAKPVAAVRELIDTLKFYADESQYEKRYNNDGDGHFDVEPSMIDTDNGEKARAALNMLALICNPHDGLVVALQEALAEMKIARAGMIGHGRAVLDAAIAKAADALEKAGAP